AERRSRHHDRRPRRDWPARQIDRAGRRHRAPLLLHRRRYRQMPRVCGNIPPAGRRRTSRAADQPARLRPGPRLPGDLTRHSRSYVSRRLELRQGPDRRGIVRLVLERMLPGIVDFPAAEIGDDAIAVAPGARLDLRRIEAAILEQAAQPLLGPAPEIEWRGMNAQQEGRADEATTARA